ncbi:aquaporin-8-like isoform X2 [Photinus pyralis]|nr:aquaporin-8-like isoform X2 [Photinus pyralis]
MGCVPNTEYQVLPQQSAFTSGMAVMISIFTFGHISGAYVNPLTSICAVIVGQTPMQLLPFYLVSEFAGGISGYGLLLLVTPAQRMKFGDGSHGVCTAIPNADLTTAQALGAEIIFSVILSLANCASWDPRNFDQTDSLPLKFGLLVGTLIMTGGAYTGAIMNPVRSFAPAVWNNEWERHWIYWVGPIFSAVVVSLLYRVLVLRGKSSRNSSVL